VVLVGPFEHHSNLLPWRESRAKVISIRDLAESSVKSSKPSSSFNTGEHGRGQRVASVQDIRVQLVRPLQHSIASKPISGYQSCCLRVSR
jgi:hypothetical protein